MNVPSILRTLALVGLVSLAGCNPSTSAPDSSGSASIDTARQEVFAASAAVAGISASVLAAHSAGILKPGTDEKDIQAGLDSARYALDQANASLKGGDAGGAIFYAQQVGDMIAALRTQLNKQGVQS